MTQPAVAFTVPGEPVAKARHRVRFTQAGHAQSYTPAATDGAQERVAWAYRQAAHGMAPNPVDAFTVTATFYVASRRRHDVDNYAKLVLDALNTLAWHDDSQVTELHAAVRHGSDNPRTAVVVQVNGQPLPPPADKRRRPPRTTARRQL